LRGNNCIYSFNENGKIIKIIGRAGQGPGEILDPRFFKIDYSGNLYIYERKNDRISILNNNGKYLGGFRLNRNLDFPFTLNNNNDIVINIPWNGYYITEYSKKGEIKKSIGKIKNLNENTPGVNEEFAEGWVFALENGNYYVFLQHLPITLVYNNNGILIEEIDMSHLPEINSLLDLIKYIPPEKRKSTDGLRRRSTYAFYDQIIYRNNKFYCMFITIENRGKEDAYPGIYIYELDDKLRLLHIEVINTTKNISFYDFNITHKVKMDLIDIENEIYVTLPLSAKILKIY